MIKIPASSIRYLKIEPFNRMKAVFIFIFLFGWQGVLWGQEEMIVLNNEPVDFKAEGFYIKDVTDGRPDKENIGYIRKGLIKRKKIPAHFKDGLEKAIYTYLKQSLRQDTTSVPVVLRITRLNISESKGLPVKGKAEVTMEFFREKGGSLGKLYEAEAFVEKPAVDVSGTHEERIRSVINTCLKSFNATDWQSVTPVYFKERDQ